MDNRYYCKIKTNLNMVKLAISLLFVGLTLTGMAQEKVYQVDELSVINYGDGRLLFRQYDKDNTPLNGSHRIIDGYRSEYILAEFKDGMYNGDYKYLKNNRLKEEGTYKEGRKDGVYKEYYSDGVALKKEAPFKEGKLNGIVKTYYTNGKLETEKGYAMSIEDGVERDYDYESGEITTDRNYKNGVLHGSQIAHYGSNIGDFIQRVTYENGKMTGSFSEIFTDGTIKKTGKYNKDGEKDGEWLERDDFPNDKGKFSGKRTLYKDGEIIKEEIIKDFVKFQQKK